MVVTGAQCTMCWHGDNLNVSSHVNEVVATAFSLKLVDLYRGRVKIHRGKVLDYLGMDLNYRLSLGVLLVSKLKHLTRVLEEWPEEFRRLKINPHASNLLVIKDDDNRESLPEEIASQFHQTVAQTVFLCMRTRPVIQTLVPFLAKKVKLVGINDRSKLIHCFLYLNGNPYIKQYILNYKRGA